MAFLYFVKQFPWRNIHRVKSLHLRSYVSNSANAFRDKQGLVLGVYTSENSEAILTSEASKYNEKINGKLLEYANLIKFGLTLGKAHIFYNPETEYPLVSLVGLGKLGAGYNEEEDLDEGRENIRIAASAGCRLLQDIGINKIFLEDLGNAESSAEGAKLGVWHYEGFKNKEKQKRIPHIELYGNIDILDWKKGIIKAEAQNLARRLMDTPSNYKTPNNFAEIASEALSIDGVDVAIRDKRWAENKKMGSFLSVAKGSTEPPVFLEINYRGSSKEDTSIALVGKGVTFDSGGISLKKPENMDVMRGDVGGASCVVGTIFAAASLKLPINIIGLIPLTENMPSGSANKPGDVVHAMNGKSITIIDTDYEGRLILADALCYAQEFEPQIIINMATLTLEILYALGGSASGAYSNSTSLINELREAGALSGDRIWRMPLWRHFSNQVTNSQYSDLINLAGPFGGSCTAAAFIQQFIPRGDWVHLDIASVMGIADTTPYLSKGMTGRPTRTLIEFIMKQANK